MPTQLRLEIDDPARLNALRAKTGADDFGEVIANALRLYEALIERHEAGHPLYERTDAGRYVEFPIFRSD